MRKILPAADVPAPASAPAPVPASAPAHPAGPVSVPYDRPLFDWQLVGPEEIAHVHAVHLDAIAGLDRALVRRDPQEHFARHTGQEGLILGCHSSGYPMMAYGVLGLHSESTSKLGRLLNLGHGERARFAVLDGVAVLRSWRGFGLHTASINERLLLASGIGRVLAGATVAPRNVASLRGLLGAGFTIQGAAILYGGYERLLLGRDRRKLTRRWEAGRRVAAGDFRAHQVALDLGMEGYDCIVADGECYVQYGRALALPRLRPSASKRIA